MQIELTDKTKELFSRFDEPLQTEHLSLEAVKDWLAKERVLDENNRLVYEQCFASLLKDTHDTLAKSEFILKNDAAKGSDLQNEKLRYARAKYVFLALAGVFYFACEGYDGMAAVLSIFSPPGIVIMLLGGLFAILSVSVFIAFDLHEIAENLGIQQKQSNALIDTYLSQQQYLEQIRMQIALVDKLKTPADHLAAFKDLIQLFQAKNKQFQQLEENYKSRKKKWYMVLLRKAAGLIAGSLFFAAGFFTAQSISIALVGLIISSVSPTALPVILLCLAGGLAGFCLYYYLQRPLVERFASWLIGIDMDKWDQVINRNNELSRRLAETENTLVERPVRQEPLGGFSKPMINSNQTTDACANTKEGQLSTMGLFSGTLSKGTNREYDLQSALVI